LKIGVTALQYDPEFEEGKVKMEKV